MQDQQIPYSAERLTDGRIKITFHAAKGSQNVSVTVDDLGFDQFFSVLQDFRESEQSLPRLRVVS